MKNLVLVVACWLMILFCSRTVQAAPDQYPGDSAIYGVQAPLQPNVMIVIDTSGSMVDQVPGGDYDPTVSYGVVNKCMSATGNQANSACVAANVYTISSSIDKTANSVLYTGNGNSRIYTTLNSITTSTCGGISPATSLKTDGFYSGTPLNANGSCNSSSTSTAYYATGNYINFLNSNSANLASKISIAKSVIASLIRSTANVKFGLMIYNNGNSNSAGYGGILLQGAPSWSSTKYTTYAQKMTDAFDSTHTKRDALLDIISNRISNSPSGGTPIAETLVEVGRTFCGCDINGANCGIPAFGATIGTKSNMNNSSLTYCGAAGNTAYVSPIDAACQRNYVVFITDGMATIDHYEGNSGMLSKYCATNSCSSDGCACCSNLGACGTGSDGGSICNNATYTCSANGGAGLDNSTPRIAQALYNDPNVNLRSYFIGFGLAGADQSAVNMLTTATDDTHGHGHYYDAGSQNTLASALTQIFATIASVNSSFVAPVVPVSPQNRTYGANRIYMGFFKPMNNKYWLGNLKKFGLDGADNVIDVNSNYATWVDVDGNGVDDLTGGTLPTGTLSGTFKPTAQSYWSIGGADAGNVNDGGTGDVLRNLTAPISSSNRTLYTMTSTAATSLSVFNSTNVTAPLLFGAGSTDTTGAGKLINFMYGQDAYLETPGNATTDSRNWLMGDVLHSRPLIVNYAAYTFNTTNEANCSINKTMIFVGSNDGMLHAFKDCDGSEAWAFIPPDLLPNLQYITSVNHTYFVDSSPTAYIYSKANDGTISSANGDKAIIIFGERRGGGVASSTTGTTGAYYALDVSDPTAPTLLWTISNSRSGYSELGETWSEPKIVKMKIGGAEKIVAVIGAGYDNLNEDGRYGATQNYNGTGAGGTSGNSGTGPVKNADGTGTAPYALYPKGRGIYLIEVATLGSNKAPIFTTSGTKLWGYSGGSGSNSATQVYDATMKYSFPSQIAVIDSNHTGYTDTLYGADTGGNIWRFSVGNSSTANWTGAMIFSSNYGYPLTSTTGGVTGSAATTDTGRKIFFGPSVVSESGYKLLYFGTGDREHPLNTNVTDRLYALKDRGQTSPVYENSMVDVTQDQLQQADTSTAGKAVVAAVQNALSSTTNYGWFIRLVDSTDTAPYTTKVSLGEKVLSAPAVFNKVAYFTTFMPTPVVSALSCSANLGISREYALNYLNGNAALNYDATNDGNSVRSATDNLLAKDTAGHNLLRTDRSTLIGTGIPSGVVLIVDPGGSIKSMIGTGGSIPPMIPAAGGSVLPLYWRQK